MYCIYEIFFKLSFLLILFIAKVVSTLQHMFKDLGLAIAPGTLIKKW
jgi:hypothetical protein